MALAAPAVGVSNPFTANNNGESQKRCSPFFIHIITAVDNLLSKYFAGCTFRHSLLFTAPISYFP